ncbi:Hint domain-containing protein [Roseovarius aestuarii]|nr:Hint domain-containing protein [Roseovarius aestuarii]
MPTTFNWIYLGNEPLVLDPTEGNSNAENAELFVGQSYGSAGDPLYRHISSATTIDNGGASGALDMNNNATNDAFSTNIGNGTQTFTFDGLSVFDATITYVNGTTAEVTAVLAQSTTGELFLVPEVSSNADSSAFEAGPIVSITLDGENVSTNTNLAANRLLQGWDDGVIDGTAGNDLINDAYVEPLTSGSDRVDNGDGLSGAGFNDDVINAGAGNDTVLAGLGNDSVSGGTGNDSLSGQAGNDTLLGQNGADTLIGGAGDDSLEGGAGNDVLYGDAGSAERWNYQVFTRNFSSADGQAFTIESGTLAASGTSAGFDVTGHGQQATGQNDPNDYGIIYTSTLIASADGVYRFETTSDDGSTLRILDSQGDPVTFTNQNGTSGTFLNNDYHQGATSRWGEVTLEEGQSYTIEARYWENLGGNVLSGRVTPPGGTAQDLATSSMIVGADNIIGNDFLDGGEGADLVFGEGGNDTLIAGENDTLYGGDGDDLFVIETPAEAGVGTITIVGGEGGETNGDTLRLTADVARADITFTNLNDAAGGLSGNFTLADGTAVSFSEIENIICFTPGARILTPHGERGIDTLRTGDMVITRDHGPQPIRWIGRRTVPGMDRFAPISIAAHVLDGATCDLLVSPQHRLLFTGYKAEILFGFNEVLVAAKHLVDGHDVISVPQTTVTYIHLMLGQHQVIYADGAATESFHAGDVGISAISDQSREEMFSVFPELRANPNAYGRAARQCLKPHEARLLLPDPAPVVLEA